jgi:hypothetical protein
MGLYVNPTNTSKENWLGDNAVELVFDGAEWLARYEDTMSKGLIPVVLVDNGQFLVVAVAYDQREARAFADASDRRSKFFAMVPRAALAAATSGVGENVLTNYGV